MLEDLKVELIEAERVAADEDGRILVWSGGTGCAVPRQLPLRPQSLLRSARHPHRPVSDARRSDRARASAAS